MNLQRATYQNALKVGGEAIAEAGRENLQAEVPSCPGWTLERLIAHVSRVYRSVARHVSEKATQMIPAEEIPRAPQGDGLLDWFIESHRLVQDALDAANPDEPVWNWAGQPTMEFYIRRMAHETTVHRWDAEAAVGQPSTIDADLACDGVSELYEVVLPFTTTNWRAELPTSSLHLHRTDGDGEWLIVAHGDSIKVTHEHAKGDAAVRASAAHLLLLSWERIGLDSPDIQTFGDATAAQSWFALSR
ncbi:MAG: maleylpyruvate isomerase family mycothiol-dependent enzyme [bacterium]|nr:maleylpyruvate isomerase family mycothiol-dependent enzyme [bacterium]